MKRAALFVGLALAAVVAPSATAKERVRATLLTPVPASSEPGDVVTVRWQLVDTDRRPFRAGGVFVRLRGAAGTASTTGFARGDGADDGVYDARVPVPSGGIAGIEIGLRGFTSGRAGTARSDVLFPITNPPPRAALAHPRPGGASRRDAIAIVAALSGGALAAYLFVRLRRHKRSVFA